MNTTAPLNAVSPSSLPQVEPPPGRSPWDVLPGPVPGLDVALGLDLDRLPRSGALALDVERAAKRLIDLLGAGVGLALLAPLLLALAVWIKLDSPGPVLFRQRRLGRHGRPFEIYKFRTMRADSEAGLGALEGRNEAARGVLFKMRHDPRVTRLGHYLRHTNLDELPQLFNVLRGEMSLVGPRPFQTRDCDRLRALDPVAFARRLEVPPGLTGAWQVGRAGPTDSEHLLPLDLDYVENWSLALDLRIIYRTFFILATGFLGPRRPR
jgi:lipopolysaccharide/colanic/teichoic acid biosynthesis glycosyltransferase